MQSGGIVRVRICLLYVYMYVCVCALGVCRCTCMCFSVDNPFIAHAQLPLPLHCSYNPPPLIFQGPCWGMAGSLCLVQNPRSGGQRCACVDWSKVDRCCRALWGCSYLVHFTVCVWGSACGCMYVGVRMSQPPHVILLIVYNTSTHMHSLLFHTHASIPVLHTG